MQCQRIDLLGTDHPVENGCHVGGHVIGRRDGLGEVVCETGVHAAGGGAEGDASLVETKVGAHKYDVFSDVHGGLRAQFFAVKLHVDRATVGERGPIAARGGQAAEVGDIGVEGGDLEWGFLPRSPLAETW